MLSPSPPADRMSIIDYRRSRRERRKNKIAVVGIIVNAIPMDPPQNCDPTANRVIAELMEG